MAIKLGFAGDFCPQGRIETAFKEDNWQHLFAEVQQEFLHNDLNVVDLECPLVADPKANPIAKTGPNLKCLPATTAILNYLNVDVVATANNHFMDYGSKGQVATYNVLEKSKIDWLGSGKNRQEAARVYYKNINGITLAIINVAENEWSTTHGQSPGVNSVDPVSVFNQLREAKQQADFTVLIAHGGNEHYNLPSPRVKELYRFFIDSGADAVVSHHTHTVSGYEVYNDCPIFYGLGNFCFDWPGLTGKPWNTGMLLQLNFEQGEQITFNYKLIKQNDKESGLSILQGMELKKTKAMIESLNQHIADDEMLKSLFDKYCQRLSGVYQTWLEPYSGQLLPGLRKRRLLPSLLTKRKKLLYTNIIRCESHREVLLNVLEAGSK